MCCFLTQREQFWFSRNSSPQNETSIQTRMTFFLLWNTKGDARENIYAALFLYKENEQKQVLPNTQSDKKAL